MNNEFAKLVAADLRLVILRLLAADADYSHNEYVIQAAARDLGHGVSRDRLHTELHWLAEQGLVAVTNPAGVLVVRLSGRGRDVAQGATVVPGIKRPEPEDI